MPNDGHQNKRSSGLLTLFAVGAGAAVAAASYFLGRAQGAEEERERVQAQPPRGSTNWTTQTQQDLPPSYEKCNSEEAKECGICLRTFESIKENNEEIHTTPCGHLFCRHCLHECLRNDPLCPFCRERVQPDQTLRIYL